jgi:hypothetical protein
MQGAAKRRFSLARWIMSDSDLRYYERRLAEELEEAARAERREVEAVHRKLAEFYRQRIETLRPSMPLRP